MTHIDSGAGLVRERRGRMERQVGSVQAVVQEEWLAREFALRDGVAQVVDHPQQVAVVGEVIEVGFVVGADLLPSARRGVEIVRRAAPLVTDVDVGAVSQRPGQITVVGGRQIRMIRFPAAHADVAIGLEIARERDPEPPVLGARRLITRCAADWLTEVIDKVPRPDAK